MNKFEMNELLDHYGGLLTEKQQEICRYYYREDFSYQEISEITGTSRSAVYDTIKRCKDDLYRFESILKLDEMSRKRNAFYTEIEKLTEDKKILDLVSECRNTENEGGNYE